MKENIYIKIFTAPFIQMSKMFNGTIKFFKDLLNNDSTVSSMRFWRLIIIFNVTTEWQYAIWLGPGIWIPNPYTVAFAAAVLGLSLFQKGMEVYNGASTEDTDEHRRKR